MNGTRATVPRALVLSGTFVLLLTAILFYFLDGGGDDPGRLDGDPEVPTPITEAAGIARRAALREPSSMPVDLDSDGDAAAHETASEDDDPARLVDLTVLVEELDGRPIADREIILDRNGARHDGGRTDDRGRITFRSIPRDYFHVDAGDGAFELVNLSQLESPTMIRIRLDRPFDVTGRVLLPSGETVPGATLLLVDRPSSDRTAIVTTSGAGGAFAFAFRGRHALLAAVAPGRAMSRPVPIGPAAADSHDLVLGEHGGVLVVKVRTQEGAPPPSFSAEIVPAPDGAEDANPRARSTPFQSRGDRADGTGEIRFEGLSPGSYRWAVFADGLAPAEGETTFHATETRTEAVTLTAGGTVRGQVTSPGRGAVPRATIRWAWPSPRPRQIVALSDARGRFVLRPLPAGDRSLEVRHQSSATSQVVNVVEGATTEVEIVLPASGAIRGRVVDTEDAPLHGLSVEARPLVDGVPREAWPSYDTTQDDGRFELWVEDVPHRVTVMRRGVDGVLAERDWTSTDGALAFRIDESATIVGVATGRVVDAEGVALEGTLLCGRADDGPGRTRIRELGEAADGRFRFEGLGAGTWALKLARMPQASRTLARFEVTRSGEVDLGELVVPSGRGRLVVEIDHPEDLSPSLIHLFVSEARFGDVATMLPCDRDGRASTELDVDGYVLRVEGEAAVQVHPFEIRDAEETRLRLRVTRGVPCVIRWSPMGGAHGRPDVIRVFFLGDLTRPVVETWASALPARLSTRANLAPGAYRVEITRASGGVTTRDIEVQPDAGAVNVDMDA